MDHLPLPQGGINIYALTKAGLHEPAQHMEVPFLDHAKYDGLGLEGAFSRMGTSEEAVLKSMQDDYAEDEFIDSCVQQYAFVALLQEFHKVIGITELPPFWRVLPDGRKIVSTRPLIDFTIPEIIAKVFNLSGEHKTEVINQISQWQSETPKRQDKIAEVAQVLFRQAPKHGTSFKGQIRAVLITTSTFMTKVSLHLYAGRPSSRKHYGSRFRICLSSMMLAEALNTVATKMLGTAYVPIGRGTIYFNTTLSQAMRNQRWCPFSTSDIQHGSLALSYVGSLIPSFDTERHEDCSKSFCAVSRLLRLPETAHCEGCDGSCGLHTVTGSESASILDNGGVPVLNCDMRNDASQYRLVDARDAGQGYVAISHVWSHGLGNDTSNSLPKCWLSQTFRMVKMICDGCSALWIDTLCVPVTQPYKQHRAKAISMMADTYQNAEAVLVLDKRLQKTTNDPTVQRYQLLFSDYMHRLWTLQEALLPGLDKVFVKLEADLPVKLAHLVRPYSIHVGTQIGIEGTLERIIANKLMVSGNTPSLWEDDLRLQKSEPRTLAELSHVIRTRDTTKWRDEALCLAVLLGLPINPTNLPTMESIYSKLGQLPSHLAFSDEPRLTSPSYHALPRSLRDEGGGGSAKSGDDIEISPLAQWTRTGLRLFRTGFIFENAQIGTHEDVRSVFSAILVDNGGRPKFICTSSPYINKALLRGRLTAIIFERIGAPWEPTVDFSSALLVTNIIKIADEYKCSYLATSNVHLVGEPAFPRLSFPQIAADYVEATFWCVD